MNYQAVEEAIKAGYRTVTPQYRRDDEIEVKTENHRRLGAVLRQLCESFPHPVSVLDMGCGTGRYFHCLANVRQLTGVDISEDMLKAAEHPVLEDEITVSEIRLQRANVYLTDFPSGSFHLIYSLGMFGNGCPVTVELCNRLYEWLVPGGKLFFDTVDLATLPLWRRARRRARTLLYACLTQRWRTKLDERSARQPFFGLSKKALEAVLRQTRFRNFQVQSQICRSPLWQGRHLECLAVRDP